VFTTRWSGTACCIFGSADFGGTVTFVSDRLLARTPATVPVTLLPAHKAQFPVVRTAQLCVKECGAVVLCPVACHVVR
jgi:hypothetical protein